MTLAQYLDIALWMCGLFYTVSKVEDDGATPLQPFQSTPLIVMSSIICTKPIQTIDPEPTADPEPSDKL